MADSVDVDRTRAGSRVRLTSTLAAASALAGAALLTACGSDTNPTPSSSPTTPQVVKVEGSDKECKIDPYLVTAGSISFSVASVGEEAIAFKVYAPLNGEFNKEIGEIARIRPGQTKQLVIDLQMGAYEVGCKADDSESRSRITAT